MSGGMVCCIYYADLSGCGKGGMGGWESERAL